MAVWATLEMLRGRLPHGAITPVSAPDETQALGWLNYAEARMRSVLAAQGLRTTYTAGSGTDDDAILILAEQAVNYAEGRFRRAKSSLEGDDENLDGQELVDGFDAFIDNIEDEATLFGAELEGGDAPESASAFRSHVTDDPTGLSVTDFAARVSMSEEID